MITPASGILATSSRHPADRHPTVTGLATALRGMIVEWWRPFSRDTRTASPDPLTGVMISMVSGLRSRVGGRDRMITLVALLAGLVAGAVLGGLVGALYYIYLGPPWGQYGYEFEGVIETLVGGVIGALVGAVAAVVLRIHLGREGASGPRDEATR
jgi:hypothetical protein